jgi:hypothetical protein
MSDRINLPYPTLLQSDATAPPKVPLELAANAEGGVLDASTFRTIEVEQLFETLNVTATRIGQASLYRSLAQPLIDKPLIEAKQAALRELEADSALREALQSLLLHATRREKDYYDLLFASFLGMASSPAHELELGGFGYETYKRGTQFMLDLVAQVEHLPEPKSAYLRSLMDTIKGFRGSRAHTLMLGPAYRTEKNILTRAEKPWYLPALKFRPSLFKPVGLGLALTMVLSALEFVPLLLDMAASVAPVFWLFVLPIALIAYAPIVGSFDRDGFIYPLRQIFKASVEGQAALDALGLLDELMAFVSFKERFGHPVALPRIVEGKRNSAHWQGLRNPILAYGNEDYVANDIDLQSERLTFITGPNSGGKTAFCKTLAQSQLLAQVGCYVPAEQAEVTVADRIFYQVPETSHLSDGEGRFGTELKRTKEVFVAASAHSLVIMDELSEGTTHKEKIEISTDILDGFRQKGNSTLLITHNHELVEHFQARGIGQARQVEFRDENPTYRLIEGISKVSHADRVARKIGFSKDDIAQLLKGG